MNTTNYFAMDVLPRRPYLDLDLCAEVIANPLCWETQTDGRIRFWGEVTLSGGTKPRILRVVTLSDGETIHNASIDSRFRKERQ